MDSFIAWLHAIGWITYAGGPITMEWVLRYAQRTMPPSQVAVVCQRAGHRYRWFSLAALTITGATGFALWLRLDTADIISRERHPAMSLADPYGRTLLALVMVWVLLVAMVSLMAFWLHPAQARRSRPGMTHEEIQAERARVGRAIKRMEWVLRSELVLSIVAVGLGASLHAGGLF